MSLYETACETKTSQTRSRTTYYSRWTEEAYSNQSMTVVYSEVG